MRMEEIAGPPQMKYFVDANGNYLGGYSGVEPPDGAVEVPTAPGDARQVWGGEAWGPVPVTIPDRVSSRQFKLQLLAAGLLDSVEGWVATQSQAVQIAYENSGTFVRDEAMLTSGFAALGFTEKQIDQFFTLAAAI